VPEDAVQERELLADGLALQTLALLGDEVVATSCVSMRCNDLPEKNGPRCLCNMMV
jgi:hypothetical protein